MSRACFLSAGGDPFLALTVLRLWQKHWYEEVDKFYVCYNNHSGVPIDVARVCVGKMMECPKIELVYHPAGIGNGVPITEMTKIAREDLVMLLEDDGFIFSSGIVDDCFKSIERGEFDAVGSPRGSCGTEIWKASQGKYGLDYTTYGDVGPNFWPNFFFCKREDLLKTDMDFGSKRFEAGSYSKELGHTFKEDNYGDTFVWGCMQLRALGLRFRNIPQYHASPTELEDKQKNEGNWVLGPPYWLHGGSLSSGWGGYLGTQTPDVSAPISVLEMESRCAFWRIGAQFVSDQEFETFRFAYLCGIDGLIQRAGLDEGRIQKKYLLYKSLLSI